MDTSSQPQATQPASSGNNMMPIILLVLAILIGLGAFFYYQNQNGNAQNDMTVTEESAAGTVEQGTTADAPMTRELAADQGVDMEAQTAEGEVKEFNVEGSAFKFDPATMEVKKGDTVRVIFNNAQGTHDWVIDEFNARTKILQAGQSETIEFVADQVGEFEYYCSVGNHRAQGMVGTLTVTE